MLQAPSESRDPFLLHSILYHESLVEARRPIAELRHRLYDVLDVVAEYAKEPFDRRNLKDITNQLHSISQDVDSLYASAGMGSMVAQHCNTARQEILEECRKQQWKRSNRGLHKTSTSAASLATNLKSEVQPSPFTSLGLDAAQSPGMESEATIAPSEEEDTTEANFPDPCNFEGSNVGDAMEYLLQSLESQKRWLQSYKSRKDIAMNLVFNLVTQQDSETSTSIARAAKADSESMKTIAILTMVFLPATSVSSFFGMAFFDRSDQGHFRASVAIWIFVVVTLLLTATTFFLWLHWSRLMSTWGKWKQEREASASKHIP